MKRRAFFGLMGGAAVAGPSIAKTAVGLTVADLHPPFISGMTGGSMEASMGVAGSSDLSRKAWAIQELKSYITSGAARERRKRETYFHGLEPDIASLRSVRLAQKIRMSKDAQFDRSERDRKGWLEGIIAGDYE